jgi:hypothetical protein
MTRRALVRRCFVLLITLLPGILFAAASSDLRAQEPQQAAAPAAVQAIGTAFTYQGRLTDNGAPASGKYDLVFALYAAESAGSQIGGNVTKEDVVVKDGYFTTQLDFGNAFNGDPRFLQIGVRPGASTSAFTPLTPRRVIQPSVYAIYADSARFATSASRAETAGRADTAGHADTAGRANTLVAGAEIAGGMVLKNATVDGIRVEAPQSDGMEVHNAGAAGVAIFSPTYDGVYVESPKSNGMEIRNASDDGLEVHNAGAAGVAIFSSTYDGVYVVAPKDDGLEVRDAASDGIEIVNAAGSGIYVASAGGYGGYFNGKVHVNGHLSKSSGSFKIDHPLDPANKYLYHSFVESPDMMNIYNGNTTLDANGEAWIELPIWFETLNKEFRYQLTSIGAPGPNLYVAETVKNNRFKIAGGTSQMTVSWQVTGIRHDAYAEANRVPVEEDKPLAERGTYLHPEAFGQAETLQTNPDKVQ